MFCGRHGSQDTHTTAWLKFVAGPENFTDSPHDGLRQTCPCDDADGHPEWNAAGTAAGERGVRGGRGIALVNADEIVMQIVASLLCVSAQCTARQFFSSFEDH